MFFASSRADFCLLLHLLKKVPLSLSLSLMPKPKFHPFSVSQGKLNNTEMEICWFLPELQFFKWHFYTLANF